MYNNIPDYLQHNSIEVEISPDLKVNPRDYFIDFSGLTKISELVCGDSGKSAVIVEYYYDLCEGQGGVGCGHERRAILCQDNYFIEDFSSSFGPRYFGPFEYP